MDLVYHWNGEPTNNIKPVQILDDTLRDGLQSPTARIPSLTEKFEILDLAARIGVQSAMIGFPGSGSEALEDTVRIAKYLGDHHQQLEAVTLGRTHPADTSAHLDVCDRSGTAVTAALVTGLSPIRAKI